MLQPTFPKMYFDEIRKIVVSGSVLITTMEDGVLSKDEARMRGENAKARIKEA